MTLERPMFPPRAEAKDSLYLKTYVTPPEDLFIAIGRLRMEARREIDRLIRFLDETENHMAIDCEPCDDDGEGEDAEPSLAVRSNDRSVQVLAAGFDLGLP